MRKILGLLLLTVFCYSCNVQLRNSQRETREIEETESLKHVNNDHGVVKKIFYRHSQDRSELKDIEFNDNNDEIRFLAAKSLRDQSDFRHIAFNDPNSEIRKFAASKLRDQSDFRRVAFNDNNDEIRFLATRCLRDQSDFRRIAFNDSNRGSAEEPPKVTNLRLSIFQSV